MPAGISRRGGWMHSPGWPRRTGQPGAPSGEGSPARAGEPGAAAVPIRQPAPSFQHLIEDLRPHAGGVRDLSPSLYPQPAPSGPSQTMGVQGVGASEAGAGPRWPPLPPASSSLSPSPQGPSPSSLGPQWGAPRGRGAEAAVWWVWPLGTLRNSSCPCCSEPADRLAQPPGLSPP